MKIERMAEIMGECEEDAEREHRKMSCKECPLGKAVRMEFQIDDSDWLNAMSLKVSPCLLLASLAAKVKEN